MSVRVAFPVLFATLRLHLDKGRQWSVVEHLILHALCERTATAAELATEGNLPRRLVIEVVIRLMRAGWVELVGMKDHVAFRATAAGHTVVKRDPLPTVTRPVSRRASFAIDRITGTVFRSRDLTLYTENRLQKLNVSREVIVLPAHADTPMRSPDEIIGTLLDDDEQYRGMDPSGARPVERFAVVTVHGASIEGLSQRAPDSLRNQILRAAGGGPTMARAPSPAVTAGPVAERSSTSLEIVFDRRDLILGAEAHRRVLEEKLRRARSWIVLHSTFVRADRFRVLLPLLGDAARRGARVDILWGKMTDQDGANTTAVEVERRREMLGDDTLRERIRLHRFSTDSHAKLLLADDGKGRMVSIVGSCYWLNSGFESYEVSALLFDPLMVAEVAGQLSTMAASPNGHWSDLTRDLAGHAANLRRAPRPGGRRVQAALVLGADHNAYVCKARDCAERRIVVASHRLGGSAETSVLIPARAAVNAHDIEVTIYYGKASGPIGGNVAAGMTRAAAEEGIQLRRIFQQHLHAKFLVWDDDDAVITSQNWLSADPPERHPQGEIGVYLSGNGIGRDIVDRTRAALGEP
jgi:cardiolipin synthase A/B